jgi:hypothetical protein
MQTPIAPERERFEKWAANRLTLQKGHPGFSDPLQYTNFSTQSAWEAWQAALEDSGVRELRQLAFAAVRAFYHNTGAEPSVSLLERTMDELYEALAKSEGK